jgi:hypothetical protein
VVEPLTSKHEAQSSNPSAQKKGREKKKEPQNLGLILGKHMPLSGKTYRFGSLSNREKTS